MKKILSLLAAFGVMFYLASCSEDDDPDTGTSVTTNEVKSGIITANETWTNDRIYELAGRVIVDDGVVLTIEPGTIIKGREGSGSQASALIVSRGAKIQAEGTASAPIIFTSALDNIAVGQMTGTNLDETDNAKWGGVVILGKAPISAEDGDAEASIEGIPADESFGLYGGSAANDNSGVFKYVSIRHGGTLIGEGNEINGLTLGGVGTGTVIDHVEIFATLDDGIEFFGGTVNVSNLLVYWQGDDGVDIDQNFSGTVDNFVVSHGAGVETDEGLEIDGPEGTLKNGLFILKNGTITNDGKEGSAADIKSKAQGTLQNIKFSGYANAKLKIRASYNNNCLDSKEDAFSHLTGANPSLVITNTEFDVIEVYTKSQNDAGTSDCTVSDADQAAASAAVTSAVATGADGAVFSGWTAASVNGLL